MAIPLYRSRERISVFMIVIFLVLLVTYIYLNHLQNNYKNVQWTGERCFSELSSVKYQLTVVTEYKSRIEKLLNDAQKAHEEDKEKFKDIMDSCVAMKQQSSICQSQFEDLQMECKTVREDLTKATKELEKYKTGG